MNGQDRPVVFLAGDSTVQTYSREHAPQAGWGQFIGRYFTDGVRFDNRAIGGRSSKTFITEGRLDALAETMKPGDWLLVQMGHNDATASRPERYTDPHTDYKRYLAEYAAAARARGATPVFVTPVGRLHYEDGSFQNDFAAYCCAMKEVAERENAPLIDLMALSLAYYTSVGYAEAESFFMIVVNGTDRTHFTEKGADVIAGLVADGVKGLNIDLSRFVR
ncbi:rhamnogalacturonan acetylesterase [Paenibacillus humicola]|uniref:rhamnogalacturonan acetylesterase n=1 Tax=Paenibacillus humicola TaxID=3110540 RepID=UPI00237A6F0E|nr:rhamnogalacturonan acetylesterase [Paenibacillus humicola]